VGTLPPKAVTANVRRPLGERLIGVGVEPLLPWPHYLDRMRDDLGVQAVGRWWRSDGSGLRMSVASLASAAMDQKTAHNACEPFAVTALPSTQPNPFACSDHWWLTLVG
jgi:hypothetical protein